jgi:uncharacterized membrane protein YhaH (DUF805 family)
VSTILASSETSSGGAAVFGILVLALVVLVIAGLWKVFTKAGEAGWKSIIPIWNVIVLLRIAGRPWWWVFLFFIPIVGFIIAIIAWNDLSKSFGKGVGFTIGLILLYPIFIMILGFGGATYLGPAGPERPSQPLPPPAT